MAAPRDVVQLQPPPAPFFDSLCGGGVRVATALDTPSVPFQFSLVPFRCAEYPCSQLLRAGRATHRRVWASAFFVGGGCSVVIFSPLPWSCRARQPNLPPRLPHRRLARFLALVLHALCIFPLLWGVEEQNTYGNIYSHCLADPGKRVRADGVRWGGVVVVWLLAFRILCWLFF